MIKQTANKYRMKVHMDGARLFNAHVASGVSLEEYGNNVDSISICLSKGAHPLLPSLCAASLVFSLLLPISPSLACCSECISRSL